MSGKRGQSWHMMLVSIIILLSAAGIIIWAITGFSEGLSEREVCRESIVIRSVLPDVASFTSTKDLQPLQCTVSRVDITKEHVQKGEVGKIIGETMLECWALFDNGDSNVYPATLFSKKSFCIPCSRIHLTPGAREELGGERIDIEKILRTEFFREVPYYIYLRDIGKRFSAFDFAFSRPFDLSGNTFSIDSEEIDQLPNGILRNRLTGGTASRSKLFNGLGMNKVTLPKFFDPGQGDLLVSYGVTIFDGDIGIGEYIPFLFYFQMDQTGTDPYLESREVIADGFLYDNPFCGTWEELPYEVS